MMVLVLRLATGNLMTYHAETGAFVMEGCPGDIIAPTEDTGDTSYGSMSDMKAFNFHASEARMLVQAAAERKKVDLGNQANQLTIGLLDLVHHKASEGREITHKPLEFNEAFQTYCLDGHALLSKNTMGSYDRTELGSHLLSLLTARGFTCEYKSDPGGVVNIMISWFACGDES